MPSKAYVKVTRVTTRTKKNTSSKSSTSKSSTKSGSSKSGNPNKCPVCGKFMGSGSHG